MKNQITQTSTDISGNLACTNEFHRRNAEKWRKCNTQSERSIIERETGVRYSCLLELPYFDATRMSIVDPMHNLLLGTAKLMIELWQSLGILNSRDFEAIQKRVDSSCVQVILAGCHERFPLLSLVSPQSNGKTGQFTFPFMA